MKKVTRTQNKSLKRKIANLSNATFSRKQTQILHVGLQSKYCQLIRVLIYIIQFDFLFLTVPFPRHWQLSSLCVIVCFFSIRGAYPNFDFEGGCLQNFRELKLTILWLWSTQMGFTKIVIL